MGASRSYPPILQNWYQILYHPNPANGQYKVYSNGESYIDYYNLRVSNEELQQYQQSIIIRQSCGSLPHIYDSQIKDDKGLCRQRIECNLLIVHISHRLIEIEDIPYPQNMYLLQQSLNGFGVLFKKYGYFSINQNLIGFQIYGKVVVWINSNFSLYYPQSNHQHINQEDHMVRNIIKMVSKNTARQRQSILIQQYIYRKKKNHTFKSALAQLKQYQNDFGMKIPDSMNSIKILNKNLFQLNNYQRFHNRNKLENIRLYQNNIQYQNSSEQFNKQKVKEQNKIRQYDYNEVQNDEYLDQYKYNQYTLQNDNKIKLLPEIRQNNGNGQIFMNSRNIYQNSNIQQNSRNVYQNSNIQQNPIYYHRINQSPYSTYQNHNLKSNTNRIIGNKIDPKLNPIIIPFQNSQKRDIIDRRSKITNINYNLDENALSTYTQNNSTDTFNKQINQINQLNFKYINRARSVDSQSIATMHEDIPLNKPINKQHIRTTTLKTQFQNYQNQLYSQSPSFDIIQDNNSISNIKINNKSNFNTFNMQKYYTLNTEEIIDSEISADLQPFLN